MRPFSLNLNAVQIAAAPDVVVGGFAVTECAAADVGKRSVNREVIADVHLFAGENER